MTGKERIRAIVHREPVDRAGFWLGNPHDDAKKIYYDYFGLNKKTFSYWEREVELGVRFSSDLFWCSPELDPGAWNHPEKKPIFDVLDGKPRKSLAQPGIFAECVHVREIENFDWPNPDYLDFKSTIRGVDYTASKGMGVFGGMWMPFFHVLSDFFGMENYFIKMHTHPEVVEAATERTLEFYLEANRRCLDLMAPKLDAFFFGNDLGSQQELLISPKAFKTFILPGFKKIIAQAQSYGLKVALHSCGAVSEIIPDFIEAGIDALHPVQALAKGMDPVSLAEKYKNDLIFIGGVDTQNLLPFGSPEQVKKEVGRLKNIFGTYFILSPSHEALLPNVSLENVFAMRDAATA